MQFSTWKTGSMRGSRKKTVRIVKEPEADALIFILDEWGKSTNIRFAPDNYAEVKALMSIVHTIAHNWPNEEG